MTLHCVWAGYNLHVRLMHHVLPMMDLATGKLMHVGCYSILHWARGQ